MTAASARLRPGPEQAGGGHPDQCADAQPAENLGPGSKERKSVLVNLAPGLGLTVDVGLNKPDLGDQIAEALGAAWDRPAGPRDRPSRSRGSTAARRIAARRRGGAPRSQLVLFETIQAVACAFVPAGETEGVTRISALTHSPPEKLGPGSKERKSALVNLAPGLGLTVDVGLNKPELGAQIAGALGATWDETCWSAGQTITLDGLNVLLGSAELRIRARGRAQAGEFNSARDEAPALLDGARAAFRTSWPADLHPRDAGRRYSQWAQDEWIAFYFEYLGLPALVNAFGGGPRTFVNTRFDSGWPHLGPEGPHDDKRRRPLNDCRRRRRCPRRRYWRRVPDAVG